MAGTHSVVLYHPKDTLAEVKAAAGFLAGYSGRTREAYTLDLRQSRESRPSVELMTRCGSSVPTDAFAANASATATGRASEGKMRMASSMSSAGP